MANNKHIPEKQVSCLLVIVTIKPD